MMAINADESSIKRKKEREGREVKRRKEGNKERRNEGRKEGSVIKEWKCSSWLMTISGSQHLILCNVLIHSKTLLPHI